MTENAPEKDAGEVDDLRREIERIKWVTEVHLSRHGLWNAEVGLAIRAGWASADDVVLRPAPVAHSGSVNGCWCGTWHTAGEFL